MPRHSFVQRWKARESSSETMRSEREYRRRVSWMKVVLPLTAFAILGLVVGWPSLVPTNPSFRLEMSDIDLRTAGRDEVLNPKFYSTDSRQQRYVVTAEVAVRPGDGSDQIYLMMPEADITLSDDEWMALHAEQGIYDRTGETLELNGAVAIYTDRGFEVHTDAASFDLAAGTARGDAPVHGQGPWGLLDAVGFDYRRDGHHFRFYGEPKLVLFARSADG